MILENWTPRERPGPDALDGAYARLERLDWSAHGDGLFAAVGGPQNDDLWTYLPEGPFHERVVFEQKFGAVVQRLGWQPLVICKAGSDDVLGMASYMRIREIHGSAEVGCVTFGPDLKRTREATDAMALMAGYIFDTLGYRRFEWKCNAENEVSRRAALRLGFSFEGIFRNDMVVKGRNRDTAWFAMTDEDWPRVKASYQTWLTPENFDTDGGQRTRLDAAPS